MSWKMFIKDISLFLMSSHREKQHENRRTFLGSVPEK
jgi:hypothetical protein